MRINVKQLIKNCVISEATKVSNWEAILADNEMLRSGIELVKEIEKLGGEAYVVGGAARDIMMGTKIKDVDIATNVPMDKIKANFRWNAIGQSQDFGIIMVHHNNEEFEVASFRSEEGTSDSRRPDSVKMVQSFETDSKRRDFTINSMGIDSNGNLVDYQHGMEDLQNKLIRAVGNPTLRFQEDALRILRALRFAVRYGFDIEPETKKAMTDLGHLITKLSSERIADELMKVAGNGIQLSKYFQHLDETGTLDIVLPELKALKGRKQNPKYHPEGDAYEHTLRALEKSRSNNPITNLAIAFHDLGKAITNTPEVNGQPTYYGHHAESVNVINAIAKRLKLSSKIRDAIVFAADNHMKGHNFNELSKKKIYNIVRDQNWEILKDVIYADALSRGDIDDSEVLENIKYAEDIANEIDTPKGRHQVTGSMEKRIKEKINGQLVMKVTGLKGGKIIGTIIKEVEDWIFDVGIDNVSPEDVINKIREVYNLEIAGQ